jgi:hypothetical protein
MIIECSINNKALAITKLNGAISKPTDSNLGALQVYQQSDSAAMLGGAVPNQLGTPTVIIAGAMRHVQPGDIDSLLNQS